MIIKRTPIMLLIVILVLAFSSLACGAGGDASISENEGSSTSTSEVQEVEDDVGVRRQFGDHALTLVGYQTFEANNPPGDNTNLLAVEFFIENPGQGDLSYALMWPFELWLPDDTTAWESEDCESRVPITERFYLNPESSATYNQCWFVPPASEAPLLVITYDFTKELVADDTVQWELHR